ncbi:unnamed protein product [Caenorhabditis angaria]|uniref:Non-structural maintenance of chromosomes element 1 homolog n=1 Tax=Caenorhabditis angaria TaxID=860376 RepID=A0A9P1I3R0_9PELO|nr:unnamed protein product [Caenorhabditis angaria]
MSDDEAEPVAHDEIKFVFEDVFGAVDKTIPTLAEVRSSATKFNDAHRYILQRMLVDPCVTMKKFNIMYIDYVATRKLKRHPSVVKYIRANGCELRDLAKTISKTINNAKSLNNDDDDAEHELGMRLVILSEESTPKEWVVLISEVQNSEIISEQSDIIKPERDFFLATIDELFENNGKITRKSAIRSGHEKFKLGLVKSEKFLNRMIKEGYFKSSENQKFIELSPRLVAEMDPYLRAKYSTTIHICDLCRRIISRPIYSAECSKCEKYMHLNCFNNATAISDENGVECQGCNTLLKKEDVLREVQNKLNEA